MELLTKRLRITPFTEQSLQKVAATFETRPHMKAYLEELTKDSSLLGWGVWLVIDKETNTIIGDIGFKGRPNSEKQVEVGYGINPSYQNKGIATEAVGALMTWAFSFDNVEKIIAECLDDNRASIRVLEKLQMKRTKPENNMLNWEIEKKQFLERM